MLVPTYIWTRKANKPKSAETKKIKKWPFTCYAETKDARSRGLTLLEIGTCMWTGVVRCFDLTLLGMETLS